MRRTRAATVGKSVRWRASLALAIVAHVSLAEAVDPQACTATSGEAICDAEAQGDQKGVASSQECGCGGGALRRDLPETRAESSAPTWRQESAHATDPTSDDTSATLTAPAEERAPHLVWIEGGEFTMGHNNRSMSPSTFDVDGEGPARRVALSSFRLGETEVSVAQWATFARATGHTSDSERFGWSFVFEGQLTSSADAAASQAVQAAPWWVSVDGADWRHPDGPGSDALMDGRANHPVAHVSWDDASAFCAWAHPPHGRLPTEAEWEYAARGGLHAAGKRRVYPWGNRLLAPGKVHRCNVWQGTFPKQNTAADGHAHTAPVRAFGAQNELGLYNMIGNVWEWVLDEWSTEHPRTPVGAPPLLDPRAPRTTGERTKKGGSYMCHKSYCNRYRVHARSQNSADTGTSNLGFRCAAPPS